LGQKQEQQKHPYAMPCQGLSTHVHFSSVYQGVSPECIRLVAASA
jgi:hypothetical protein